MFSLCQGTGGKVLLALVFTCLLHGEAHAHSGHIIEGTLGFVVGDPDPERRQAGETQKRVYEITADDGHVISVDVSRMQMPEGGLRALRNRRVRVTATPEVQSQAFGAGQRFAARTLEVISPPVVADQPRGNQKYLSLLCKFSAKPQEPRTPSWFTTQLGDNYPGFGHFFREASYEELTLTGSTAHSTWVPLPRTAAQYKSAGGNDPNVYLRMMFEDCTRAANATVDFSQYYGINLMFNGTIDCCAWGGSMYASLDGVLKYWPLTWMPYYGEGTTFGWRDHGILAHEMSHSFGSSHSEDPSGYQYGSSWDVVSNPGGTCAVSDPQYGCLGQSQIAYNKTAMEILPLARIAHHGVGAASTPYVIERLTQPEGVPGAVLMVKVAIAGSTTNFYTIESRQRVGYDQNIPGDGVLIHRVSELLANGTLNPQPAQLLAPVTGSQLGMGIQAIWNVGSVYRSAVDDVKITVIAFDQAAGTAQVSVGPARRSDTVSSSVQLEQSKYVVTENAGAATLMVGRTSITGLDSGSIKYSTVPGTALAGSDYVARSGTLNWAEGDSAAKPIVINIANNSVAEAPEAFRVVLSAPSLGISVGTPGSATVVILDDDEAFPKSGAMPPGFVASPGDTRSWHVSTDAGAYEGQHSLKSDQLEDGESAGVEMVGTFAAGAVRFRVKVSSETTFDRLEFYIDGVLQAPTWSGTKLAGWQLSPAYRLPAGMHTLRWVYLKDATASVGMDAAYLDALVTPTFTPAP